MSRGKLLLMAGVAAFVAVMLAGPGATIFPSTLRWGAWAACPDGTAPTPRRFRESYNRPGESQVAFYCVASDGTAQERTLAAMGGLFLMYFAGGFAVLSLLALRGGRAPGEARSVPTTMPSGELETKARALLARDQKIHAIKLVREATGMGLAEAKDWVEALPQRPPSAPRPVAAATAGSASERLAELKRMLDAGLITQPEFDEKKREILAEL